MVCQGFVWYPNLTQGCTWGGCYVYVASTHLGTYFVLCCMLHQCGNDGSYHLSHDLLLVGVSSPSWDAIATPSNKTSHILVHTWLLGSVQDKSTDSTVYTHPSSVHLATCRNHQMGTPTQFWQPLPINIHSITSDYIKPYMTS